MNIEINMDNRLPFVAEADAAELKKAIDRSVYVKSANGVGGINAALRCVLLQDESYMQEPRVRVTSTDLLIQTSELVKAAEVDEQGPSYGDMAVLPNARQLSAALTGLEGMVRLEQSGDDLIMKQGHRRYVIQGVPVTDLPLFPSQHSKPLPVDTASLADAIDKVDYAVPKVTGHKYLEVLRFDDGALIACDGTRMAIVDLAMPLSELSPFSLPGTAIAATKKVIRSGGQLSLLYPNPTAEPNFLEVAGEGGSYYWVMLADSRYFDWRTAERDTKEEWEIQLEAGRFLPIIQRVGYFCDEQSHQAICVSANDDELMIQPKGKQESTINDSVVVPFKGQPDCAISGKFIADILKVAGSDVGTWHGYNDASQRKSHVVRFKDRTDRHYMAPVRR